MTETASGAAQTTWGFVLRRRALSRALRARRNGGRHAANRGRDLYLSPNRKTVVARGPRTRVTIKELDRVGRGGPRWNRGYMSIWLSQDVPARGHGGGWQALPDPASPLHRTALRGIGPRPSCSSNLACPDSPARGHGVRYRLFLDTRPLLRRIGPRYTEYRPSCSLNLACLNLAARGHGAECRAFLEASSRLRPRQKECWPGRSSNLGCSGSPARGHGAECRAPCDTASPRRRSGLHQRGRRLGLPSKPLCPDAPGRGHAAEFPGFVAEVIVRVDRDRGFRRRLP